MKKLLQGPAKELTQCYRDTAADFKNMTEALKERYDQPDILLSYLQRKLRDMRIPDRETAASLRSFYTQIQALCRQLTDAGRNTDDPMITDTIYSKLPAKMKTEVAKQRLANPADGWSTQRLLLLMKAHVRLAEHISLSNEVQYSAVERKDVSHHRNVHAIQTTGTSPEEDVIPSSELFDDESSYSATSATRNCPSLSYDSRHPSSNVVPASNVVLQLYGEEAKRYMQDKVAPPPNKRSGPPHMRKWNDSNDQRKLSGPPPCLFCTSPKHRSTNCDKYTTLVARRNRITGPDAAFRRCTRCLNPKHEASTCRRREPCRTCLRKGKKPAECAHHHLLCPLKYPNGCKESDRKDAFLLAREDTVAEYERHTSYASERRDDADSDVDSVDYGNTDSEAEEPHAYVIRKEEDVKNVFFLGAPETRKTLMMTAKVDVSNVSDNSQKRQCTIFFDSGSSDTLIDKAFARQLDLPILKRSMTTFRSFADGGKGREMDTWEVQFDVHLRDGTRMTIEATAVDEVCGPLPTMSFGPGAVAEVLAVSHKAFTVTMDQPQILIGLNHLHNFDLVRHRQRLPNGFSVYDSRVEPIICGQGKIRAHQRGAATNQDYCSNLTNKANDDGLIRIERMPEDKSHQSELWSDALGPPASH
ncbi:Pao retrotransposon peptidase family protein [Aphelenchoides avenae]|nr:Pao retrotransposon peptidase family protein [Aphelenchus avenae]